MKRALFLVQTFIVNVQDVCPSAISKRSLLVSLRTARMPRMSRKMITKLSTRDSVRKLNGDSYGYQENTSILAASPFRFEYPTRDECPSRARQLERAKRENIRIEDGEREKESGRARERERPDLSRVALLAIREGPPHGILSRHVSPYTARIPIVIARWCKLQPAAACCSLRPKGGKLKSSRAARRDAGYIPGVSGFVVPYIQRYIFYFT